MRIVAVADTHTFEADLGPLPDGDLLIHAGDLLRGGSLQALAPVAEWLRSQPHRYKVVVAGNHDGCFARDLPAALALLGPSIHYLQDSGVTVMGARLWGSPWQPAYHDWAFNLPRGEALARQWALIPQDVDILITHGPPRGYGDRVIVPGRAGCDDLLQAVQRARPALHLFGHIHHDGGVWSLPPTTLANVTTWECERAPSVFDYDPATRQVTCVQIPPAQGALR